MHLEINKNISKAQQQNNMCIRRAWGRGRKKYSRKLEDENVRGITRNIPNIPAWQVHINFLTRHASSKKM